MEKQKYQQRDKISHKVFELYKTESETRFIIYFLKSLPIEKLKELISFETINPLDKIISESLEEANYRQELREFRCVEYRAKIEL